MDQELQQVVADWRYLRENTLAFINSLSEEELKKIDDVAYVRFASVYRQFSDINTFMEELKEMLGSRSKNIQK